MSAESRATPLLSVVSLLWIASAAGACLQDPETETVVEAEIGAAGGALAGPDGVAVEIPVGALAGTTTITITTSPKSTTGAVGPAYAFGPAGTQFSLPVKVTLPFDPARLPSGAAASDVAIWTAPQGSIYFVPLPQSVNDADRAHVQTKLFAAFVAIIPPPPMLDPTSYAEVTIDGHRTRIDCTHMNRDFFATPLPSNTIPILGGESVSTGIELHIVGPTSVVPFQVGAVPGDYTVLDGDLNWTASDPLFSFKLKYPVGGIRYVTKIGGPDAATYHRVQVSLISSTGSSATYRIWGRFQGTMHKYDASLAQPDLGELPAFASWSLQVTYPAP